MGAAGALAAAQAAAGTVGQDAEAAARALRASGVNVTLAPVGDVASVPGAALAGRAFSTDFQAAADAMAESVRGWREGGVAPTAKHFPGLGGAVTNTDDGPATIERTAQQIRDEDLVPFRAAIDAGVPLVMAGHALYPALDGDRIASQSQPIIDGLLRDELGFEGVVITDSTEAAAVQAVTGVQEAAVRNVRAGVDIVLTTGRGSYIQVYRALLAEARRDPAFRERVRGVRRARRGAPAVAALSRGGLDSAQGGPGTASQRAEPRSGARVAPARPRRDRRRACSPARRCSSLLHDTYEWPLGWALLGTLLGVAAFRGLVDVLAHRLIPAPSLYGAEARAARPGRHLAAAAVVLAAQVPPADRGSSRCSWSRC